MPATVRQYELVYIVHPDRSDEQVQQVIAKYNTLITTQGGTLERTDLWERRRLAYEIKGQSEGIYIVCVFRGLPSVEAELRRVFRISEDTLRFIIIRPDEEIDTSVPSVQPRDYGARSMQSSHGPSPSSLAAQSHAPAPAAAPAPVAAEAAPVAVDQTPVAEAAEAAAPDIEASAETEEAAEPVAATA